MKTLKSYGRKESRQYTEAYAKAVGLKRTTPDQVRQPARAYSSTRKKHHRARRGRTIRANAPQQRNLAKLQALALSNELHCDASLSDKRGKRASPDYAWSFSLAQPLIGRRE